VFDAIRGKDPLDSTSYDLPASSRANKIQNLRIGVPKEYFVEGMDKEIRASIMNAIQKFEKAGAKVEEVSLPLSPYALAVYYILMPAEVSANLARFDGVRYAPLESLDQEMNLSELYRKTRGQGFGDEARRRIMLGTYLLSHGYRDAYYKQAQKVRTLIANEFEQVFQKVDVLCAPTTPTTAFRLGEKTDDPLTMYLSDIFTVSVNVAGIPAISLPCGESQGLPIGLQIMGPLNEDELVLRTGAWFENLNS
jgi:aspartyl-tRNA(Asn)/glutamyl-tRNA(Gln) amidotransferase subunit A